MIVLSLRKDEGSNVKLRGSLPIPAKERLLFWRGQKAAFRTGLDFYPKEIAVPWTCIVLRARTLWNVN